MHELAGGGSRYVAALCALVAGATASIRGRAAYPPALDAPLRSLLDALADVAGMHTGQSLRERGAGPAGAASATQG